MNAHPHELAPLMLDLGSAGVELSPHPASEDLIRHRPAVLPPDLGDRIVASKPALLRLLREGIHPEPGSDAEYVLLERLGVADDLRMPTHVGSPGWLISVAESMESVAVRQRSD